MALASPGALWDDIGLLAREQKNKECAMGIEARMDDSNGGPAEPAKVAVLHYVIAAAPCFF
jgi:hypothetical protein